MAMNSKAYFDTTVGQELFTILTSVLDNTDEGIFSFDMVNNRPIYVAGSCETLLGYNADDYIRNPQLWFEIIVPEDREATMNRLMPLTTGQKVEVEYRVTSKDKQILWINLKAIPTLQNGILQRIDGIMNDVSARKKSTQRLQNAYHELDKLFNTIEEVIFSVDIEKQRLKHISNACKALYGRPPEDFYADIDLWQKIVVNSDMPIIDAHNKSVLAGKTDVAQYRIMHTDGTIRWVENKVIPTLNAEGKLVAVDGIARDITPQKEAIEQRLISDRNAADYRKALEEGAHITITDALGKIRYANDNFCRISKYTREELIGQDHRLLNSGFHPKAFIREFWETISAGKIWRGEFCNRAKDGTLFWVDNTIVPFMNEEGKPVQYISIRNDITNKKLAEQKLRESEQQFREFYELAPEGIVIYDPVSGLFTDSNDKCLALLKISEDQLKQMGPADISPAYQQDGTPSIKKAEEYVLRCLEGEKPVMEWLAKDSTGRIFPCEVRLVAVHASEGRLIRASFNDISERKEAQEKLARSEANMSAILDNTETAYVLADTEMNIVSFNKKATENVPRDFKMDIKEGLSVYDFLHPSRREAVKAEAARVLAGEEISYEVDLNALYGSQRWYRMDLVGVRDETGKAIGIIIAMNDITPFKKIEMATRDLNEQLEKKVAERTAELEQSNKDLESFSYSVSHDLMAPLRVMNGFAQILQEDYSDKLDAEGKKCIDVIAANATRMGHLINDLLEFSRMGRKPMQDKSILMTELVKVVLEEVKGLAGAAFHAEIHLHTLKPATGDPAMLKQVWINLVSNAVKYSSKKENPVIEIGMIQENGEDVYFIRDNGAGFDMIHADKLFGVFHRLHRPSEFEGTGVGLALVHRVITKHGGRIWADAKPNEGATFYFTLH